MRKSLTDITTTDLEQVREFAALFFAPKDIALMVGIDNQTMLDEVEDEKSSLHQAFYTGRLKSEAELRKSIVKLAKSGSSPAQTMSLDLLMKSNVKMLGR